MLFKKEKRKIAFQEKTDNLSFCGDFDRSMSDTSKLSLQNY